jgi:hypothetical protein
MMVIAFDGKLAAVCASAAAGSSDAHSAARIVFFMVFISFK